GGPGGAGGPGVVGAPGVAGVAGGPRVAGGPGVAGGPVELPRATGARDPAWLGSDELGPRLIANRPRPSGPRPPAGGNG
ncbi:MAG: hypothetical protein ACRDYE_01150, partial [Acidimicrobiales bacterium]